LAAGLVIGLRPLRGCPDQGMRRAVHLCDTSVAIVRAIHLRSSSAGASRTPFAVRYDVS
jgi:hypothetical protein